MNLMPKAVLRELSDGWESRAATKEYGHLSVTVPAPADLMASKIRRGEPRDLKHADWAVTIGLISQEEAGK